MFARLCPTQYVAQVNVTIYWRTDILRQTQQSNSKSLLSPGHQQMLPWHRGLPTGISSWFLPWVPFL
jgi:hypothetical protein